MAEAPTTATPSGFNPFAGPGGPRPEDLSRCVHCGLCLNACPTYLELGIEMESPRGRIALVRGVQEGRIPLTAQVESHFDRCLQCRACEVACPSGVAYGRIMEDTRAAIHSLRGRRPAGRLQTAVLRHVVGRPRVLGLAVGLARLNRSLRLGWLIRRARFLPARLRDADAMLPRRLHPRYPARGRTVTVRARGEHRGRVAMLSGCVMAEIFGPANLATARVLAENGFDVVIPGQQSCCGALHLHDGDREGAKALARRNLRPFLKGGFDALIVNSAGCGSTLKEYGALLAGEQRYEEDARRLGAMTRDVNEFLAALPLRPPRATLPWSVTYQDPCHLAHAQRIKDAPRAVLRAIPGLELREMEASDRCCGSAGVYSLLQPELSRALLRRKLDDIDATGAGVVVTANPGCMLQLDWGLRSQGGGRRVLHTVEVLDAAYRAERDGPATPG